MGRPTRAVWVLGFAMLLFCALPAVAFSWLTLQSPHMDAQSARRLLLQSDAQISFIEAAEAISDPIFEQRTIPLSKVQRERPTLLMCRSGIKSLFSARRLRLNGFSRVWSVDGGIQEWIASAAGRSPDELELTARWHPELWPNFRRASVLEQGLLLGSFFGIKTLYTLLSLGLVAVLWRHTKPELVALRRALLGFLVGETSCFFNVMLFSERCVVLEHIHGLFMAVSLGFACFALFTWLRQSLFRQSETLGCSMNPFCGLCTQRSVCRLRRLAQFFVPILAALALIPLAAELQDGAYTTLVLGRLHGYGHPVIHQLFELRYLPLVAILLYLACEASLLLSNGSEIEGLLFSAASGALGFSYLRMVFVAPFANRLVWFAVWEELTELFYVGAICAVLWIFRVSIFERRQVSP
jgi:rhodanese-related sulfurtransferase